MNVAERQQLLQMVPSVTDGALPNDRYLYDCDRRFLHAAIKAVPELVAKLNYQELLLARVVVKINNDLALLLDQMKTRTSVAECCELLHNFLEGQSS